jgi:hypothetical protein
MFSFIFTALKLLMRRMGFKTQFMIEKKTMAAMHLLSAYGML